LAELLIDARYRELWPSIEAWAGSDLSKQWAAYRDELKREWEASNDFEAGTAYARALAAQGDYRTVVATFLPFLSTDLPSPPPHGFEYLASPVSRSLSAVGRHDEGLALLRRLEAMVPPDQDVQRLNFSANIAREQLAAGRPAEALASIEQSLQQARRHGEAVNVSALVSMHNVRACALHGLGRGADAADSIAYVTAHQGGHLATYISLLACLGRKDDARNFLITALADDGQRSAALFFVQPNTFVPRTDYQVSLDRFRRGLITDLEVIATAKRYGRILAFPLPLTGG
jgi:tetratricopeptide (TPR) repeat protein